MYSNTFIHSLVMLVIDRQTKIPTEINISFAARRRLWYISTRLNYPNCPLCKGIAGRASAVSPQKTAVFKQAQDIGPFTRVVKNQTDNSVEYLTGLTSPANERRRYIVTTSLKPRISPVLTEHKTLSQLWDTLRPYIHQLPVFCFDHSVSLDMKLPFFCPFYVPFM